jgi:hypothetical protein
MVDIILDNIENQAESRLIMALLRAKRTLFVGAQACGERGIR